jgi:hypothetical protein
MHENLIMAKGTMLAPTQNAPESHSEVHLDYMNSPEYDELIKQNPGIKDIFEKHAFGEHDLNPKTGSVGAAAAAVGGDPNADPNAPVTPDGGGAAAGGGGGGVGGGAGAGGGGENPAPIDLQPSTVGGADQRDTQQAQAA